MTYQPPDYSYFFTNPEAWVQPFTGFAAYCLIGGLAMGLLVNALRRSLEG